ncbi:MAG TPA: nitroreductase family protein [Haliangium sp.]|nr:nitroreductase family protein [Haliangium sp.]
MDRPAPTDHPVHELTARRYSPRAFTDEDVTPAQVLSLLEAARWAASCFNEQPWRYIVAMRSQPEVYEKLLGCLVEANRVWASKAPALMLSVASTHFAHNGKPNPHAWHDLGQASASMAIQAAALGLQIHQMAGFDRERARAEFAIPEGFEPVAAIAVGHPGDASLLPEPLRERESAPRQRRPVADFIHGSAWGERPGGLEEEPEVPR